MDQPVFRNRYEAIIYWKQALYKEDEKLQEEVRYRTKRMREIQDIIQWNMDEIKREQRQKKEDEAQNDTKW